MFRKGQTVTCQFALYGEQGYRKSVPVVIEDIKSLKHGKKEYWIRKLGLSVVGIAHIPDERSGVKAQLFCAKGKFVGYYGQQPQVKAKQIGGVGPLMSLQTHSDAVGYLGYYEED